MKPLGIFFNLKLEKDGDTILVNSNGEEVIIELSNQKILKSLKKISFGGSSFYKFSILTHKSAKLSSIKIIIKTPDRTILSLGDTSYYSLKNILLQIANFFDK